MRIYSVALLTLVLAGCATPKVVEQKSVGDEQLSCTQLEAEMKDAERYKAEAQKEKGATGTNVAAAIFFWPAMVATYSNANDAIAAAEVRKSHLMDIYKKKRCVVVAADDTPYGRLSPKEAEEQINALKSMKDKGMISAEEFEEKRAAIVKSM